MIRHGTPGTASFRRRGSPRTPTCPADETLDTYRPAWLFRPGVASPEGKTVCPADLFGTGSVAATGYPSGAPLCTAINRPEVPTIYPPGAEIYFLTVRAAVPDSLGYLPFQLGGLLISVAVTLMLLAVLGKAAGPLHLAAAWAWSPLVQLEAVNNAHVDVLGRGAAAVRGNPAGQGQALALRCGVRSSGGDETHSCDRRPRTALPAARSLHCLRCGHLCRSVCALSDGRRHGCRRLPARVSEGGRIQPGRRVQVRPGRDHLARTHGRAVERRCPGRRRRRGLAHREHRQPVAPAGRNDRADAADRQPRLPLVRADAAALHRPERALGVRRGHPRLGRPLHGSHRPAVQ